MLMSHTAQRSITESIPDKVIARKVKSMVKGKKEIGTESYLRRVHQKTRAIYKTYPAIVF